MKKFILCSLLINIAFYSAYGAAASSLPAPDQGVNNLPDLPDINTFFDDKELSDAKRQRAQELEEHFKKRIKRRRLILPKVRDCPPGYIFESFESFERFELCCNYCTKIYSLPNPSQEAIDKLEVAFKKHQQRCKNEQCKGPQRCSKYTTK